MHREHREVVVTSALEDRAYSNRYVRLTDSNVMNAGLLSPHSLSLLCQRRRSHEQTHAVRQDITMDIRVLAVASLTFFLVIMAAAGAEDVKIMGLIATNA